MGSIVAEEEAIEIVRVSVSFSEDQYGYQEMDFIVKTKYQGVNLRLLGGLDYTEETMTGHLGHGALICSSTSR